MRIVNRTAWRTDQLRHLARAVAKREIDAEHRCRIRIIISYRSRFGSTLGCCTVGTGTYPLPYVRLYLPRHQEQLDIVRLAHTLAHEFGHANGLRHRNMNKTRRYGYAKGWREDYAWAMAFPLEQKPAKTQLSAEERIANAIQHAEGKIVVWERAVRRAQRKVKAWRQRAARYEKRLAALKTNC
jgi:hypothetical protein